VAVKHAHANDIDQETNDANNEHIPRVFDGFRFKQTLDRLKLRILDKIYIKNDLNEDGKAQCKQEDSIHQSAQNFGTYPTKCILGASATLGNLKQIINY